jgi:hypothetical protein
MMRISLSYIFDIASRLEPLERLEEKDTAWQDVWLDFLMAQTTLEGLYISSPYAPFMRSSATLANQLNDMLKKEGDNPTSLALLVGSLYLA